MHTARAGGAREAQEARLPAKGWSQSSPAMTWFLVALGGALGSLGRHGLGLVLAGVAPAGTLAANILGCGLIGYLHARLGADTSRALLMTGFCGGFTT